jgi:murein DD-endopeptidase MepM/ murein hydrolase activator NlpD
MARHRASVNWRARVRTILDRHPMPLAPRLGRWLGVALASFGVAAVVVAGLDLFAGRSVPFVERAPSARTPHVHSGAPAGKASPPPAVPAARAASTPTALRPPLDGRLLATFGWAYSPTFRDWRFHEGEDLAGVPGEAVVAAADGRVVSVERSRLWGGVIRLDVGGGVTCVYRGLGRVDVRPGDRVVAGQPLGEVGPQPTAEPTETTHVHWEVWRDGRPVDPAALAPSKP